MALSRWKPSSRAAIVLVVLLLFFDHPRANRLAFSASVAPKRTALDIICGGESKRPQEHRKLEASGWAPSRRTQDPRSVLRTTRTIPTIHRLRYEKSEGHAGKYSTLNIYS
ncbi:uncharacterized protein LOC119160900 isoform X3 [Rhipicephalus microplus]|uniref:uncharacterized protein LOC119160900 isoform X3 n=1 Tax=Rhipicephalus microplus TaxID=6941 RepID=UPI003F6BDF5B